MTSEEAQKEWDQLPETTRKLCLDVFFGVPGAEERLKEAIVKEAATEILEAVFKSPHAGDPYQA